MKTSIIGLCLLGLFSTMGFASEELYQASKTMITKTTEMRIEAVYKNDFKTVCNAINSTAGIDTMVYYLSFEIFENEEHTSRLYKELGPFYTRNLHSLYKQGLPQELHGACANKDNSKIKDVMESINSTMSLE